MIKKFYSFITSLPFMAFLLFVLIVALAIATFVENSHGTANACAFIYNAHWFEALWLLLAINLFHNLRKFRLFSSRKISVGLFHIAFLIMILGAAITRYCGYEGKMHIREGQQSDYILSTDNYFYTSYEGKENSKKVCFSELAAKHILAKFRSGKHHIKVKSVKFIHNAEKRAVACSSGEPIVDFVLALSERQGMQPYSFREGDTINYPGFTVGFNTASPKTINFFQNNGRLFMTSGVMLEETTMAIGERKIFNPGDTIEVKPKFLYGMGHFRFLVRKYLPNARFMAVKSPVETNIDAVLVEISDNDSSQIVSVLGHSGTVSDTANVPLTQGVLKLAYGTKHLNLPFNIRLNDFQLNHYPGSKSPSSFASEITLIDSEKDVKKDFRIFMNNTLRYRGYKFFQSSYDPDEQGTILSVNHDFWGTSISYLGYAVLFLGIILSLISKNSHFQQLVRKLKQSQAKTIILVLFCCGVGTNTFAQTEAVTEIDIDKQIVNDFSELWVQGVDGRIEPVSTLSSEIIRKITGRSIFLDKRADEIMLSMMVFPEYWQTKRVIKIKNKALAKKLGAKGKYISIRSLFDKYGNYKIANSVRSAYAKNPAMRNRVDKEYIYLDERVNICFMVFRGAFLHIYPSKDRKKSWYCPGELTSEFVISDSVFVKNGLDTLLNAVAANNNLEATKILTSINKFQQKYGEEILPFETQKKVEILYNKLNPFKRVFPFYLLLGFFLLCILFINIFRLKPLPHILQYSFYWLIFLLFIIHSVGLVMRWYIAGHAPWSNGYESIVYVAWATMLAGFLFGRKSPMVIGIAAFLSGIALFVAHLSWMNPEVTNLVPVLKSYWLTLHVAVITASYGFLGLSMFIGLLVMVLVVIRNKNNVQNVAIFIERLTIVNEMSATVGLYFLTMGTFLGAIWANESWGRYWGWDPKETWALITILVYAFVAHMRLIPSFKSVFSYNLASILSFLSVIMTYFGVNYYLTGLHAYGGDLATEINPSVFIFILILAVLIIWAYIKDLKFRKE